MKTIVTLDRANKPYGYPQLDGSGSLHVTGSLYGTASYALNGGSNIDTGSFATTGSNLFTDNQTIDAGSTDGFGSGTKYTNQGYAHYTAGISGSTFVIADTSANYYSTWAGANIKLQVGETDSAFNTNLQIIGTETITGSNGVIILSPTIGSPNYSIQEIHGNDDSPWIARFYNDTFSKTNSVMSYFGWNDGRFVFHNDSTHSIGLQVNGYSGENGLIVYEDKVAFINNVEVTGSVNLRGGRLVYNLLSAGGVDLIAAPGEYVEMASSNTQSFVWVDDFGTYIQTSGSYTWNYYNDGTTSMPGGVTAPSFTGSLEGTASWALSASWAPGGGGTPGGLDTYIQYNNAGNFNGNANFTYKYASSSLQQGLGNQAIGKFSHAEGEGTYTGLYGYASTGSISITSGIIYLDSTYGDVSGEFNRIDYIVLDDSDNDNLYGIQAFEIIFSSTTFDGTSTVVQLIDTSVNTTIANIGIPAFATPAGADQIIAGGSSHAEGVGTMAVGYGSHAEGDAPSGHTVAIGKYSHAEGSSTRALGLGSHAEGHITIAVGVNSHAEGENTYAIGDYSHTEGSGTSAAGHSSHAEGLATKATNNYSHAEGIGTVTGVDGQTAMGQYNTVNSSSLVVIGNGTDDSNRSDLTQFNPNDVNILVPTLYISQSQFNNQNTNILTGTTTVSQISTGSYTSAFYNYTVASGSNARSGQIMSVWIDSTINYTETTTLDIGDTSAVTCFLVLSGDYIQLDVDVPTDNWVVKTMVNLL